MAAPQGEQPGAAYNPDWVQQPHLITSVCPGLRGPPGASVAVCTELGWALQGPTSILSQQADETVCLHFCFIPHTPELYKDAERLWQLDILPFRRKS